MRSDKPMPFPWNTNVMGHANGEEECGNGCDFRQYWYTSKRVKTIAKNTRGHNFGPTQCAPPASPPHAKLEHAFLGTGAPAVLSSLCRGRPAGGTHAGPTRGTHQVPAGRCHRWDLASVTPSALDIDGGPRHTGGIQQRLCSSTRAHWYPCSLIG